MRLIEKLLLHSSQGRSSYAPFWPQDNIVKTLKPLKISTSMLTDSRWDLCLIALDDFNEIANEVSALSRNSVETNIFFEPEFLGAGIHRVKDKGVMHLCLWEGTPEKRILRCFMPVLATTVGLPRHKTLTGFTHDFAPLGTPLLHRENAAETTEYLLRLLCDPALELPTILALDQQRLEGKTIGHFINAANSLGLNNQIALARERAELNSITADDINAKEYIRKSVGKKRSKEYARQLRRLAELGDITFQTAKSPERVLDAIEEFLTLESRGWKGRGGTALYSLKQIAAFSRQAISALAETGRCEIRTMKLNDAIIAGLVSFKIRGEYFTWKIAFDEGYSSHSPGVQIMLNTSEDWLRQAGFVSADSLAIPNHKMIDHLWRDRQSIGSLLIETGNKNPGHIERVAAAVERHRRARNMAKSLLARIMPIRVSLS